MVSKITKSQRVHSGDLGKEWFKRFLETVSDGADVTFWTAAECCSCNYKVARMMFSNTILQCTSVLITVVHENARDPIENSRAIGVWCWNVNASTDDCQREQKLTSSTNQPTNHHHRCCCCVSSRHLTVTNTQATEPKQWLKITQIQFLKTALWKLHYHISVVCVYQLSPVQPLRIGCTPS